jgi:hypothetical protein
MGHVVVAVVRWSHAHERGGHSCTAHREVVPTEQEVCSLSECSAKRAQGAAVVRHIEPTHTSGAVVGGEGGD